MKAKTLLEKKEEIKLLPLKNFEELEEEVKVFVVKTLGGGVD